MNARPNHPAEELIERLILLFMSQQAASVSNLGWLHTPLDLFAGEQYGSTLYILN